MSSVEDTMLYVEIENSEHPLRTIPLAITDTQNYEREYGNESPTFVILGKEAIVAATLDYLCAYMRDRAQLALGVRGLSMVEMLKERGVHASGFTELTREIADSLVDDPSPSFDVYVEALSQPRTHANVKPRMAQLAVRHYDTSSHEPLSAQEQATFDTYNQAYDALFVPQTGFRSIEELVQSQAGRYQ